MRKKNARVAADAAELKKPVLKKLAQPCSGDTVSAGRLSRTALPSSDADLHFVSVEMARFNNERTFNREFT
jgi:hypothetical protein